MSETAIEEVVGLSRRAGKSADKLTRQLENHREFALLALKAAQADLNKLVEQIEDDATWVYHARVWTGHAGYSNGIQGNVSTAYVRLGSVTAIVDTVVF